MQYKQSEESGKFEASDNTIQVDDNLVKVVFKQNRKKELHVNGEIIIFGPNEAKYINKSIIETSDFKTQAHEFVVVEG